MARRVEQDKVIVDGFINIYVSGFYHTADKPGMFNRHPGDIYETREAAEGDIHPRSHYVATIPVQWEEPLSPGVNPTLEESFDGVVVGLHTKLSFNYPEQGPEVTA